MMEHEVIAEMYAVSKQIERLKARLDELTERLYRRDEFVKYIKSKRFESQQEKTEAPLEKTEAPLEKTEAPQEKTEAPLDDPDVQFILYRIRRNKNGISAYSPRTYSVEAKIALQRLLDSHIIHKVKVGTNYYYQEV